MLRKYRRKKGKGGERLGGREEERKGRSLLAAWAGALCKQRRVKVSGAPTATLATPLYLLHRPHPEGLLHPGRLGIMGGAGTLHGLGSSGGHTTLLVKLPSTEVQNQAF